IWQCEICGEFFLRKHLHSKTRRCPSKVCRDGHALGQLLPDDWKRAWLRRVATAMRNALDDSMSHQMYALFFGPVMLDTNTSMASLRRVSNRKACIAAWRFIFADTPDARVRDALRECAQCERLFCAFHGDDRTCSRKCWMSRYRQLKVASEGRN